MKISKSNATIITFEFNASESKALSVLSEKHGVTEEVALKSAIINFLNAKGVQTPKKKTA